MFTRLLHVTGITLCVAFLLGATQCQTTTNGIGSNGPVFVTSLEVEDASGNVASTFNSGDQIQFVLSVRNRSTTSETISFSTAQQYNFEVVDSGTATEVWTWSLGQFFSQSTTSLTFQAGQTQTFTVTWNQLNDTSQLVPTGSYEAIGGMTCNNSSSSSSSSSSSASITCMPTGIATSSQLAPSVYISTLVPFTIQ
jgi:Intracellular proteinase inhibitor